MNANYKCITSVEGIREYIGDAKIIAFDYETAPDEAYRNEDKAALDAHKAHIVGCSFSVSEGSGIYVPVAHKVGKNIEPTAFDKFLREFLSNTSIVKIAHNLAFESQMSYACDIVIMPPVYDTIAASQMSLKSCTEFRKLADSGLKKLAAELCGEPLPSFTDVTDGRHFDKLDAQDAETVRYGAADSDYSLRLYHIFNKWFDRFLPKHRIQGLASWLWDKVSGWISGIWDGICDFFGIASPSKEMGWVGEMLVDGLAGALDSHGKEAVKAAEGMSSDISDVMHGLAEDMETALPTDFNIDGNVRASVSGTAMDSVKSGLSLVLNISNFNNYSSEDIQQLTNEVLVTAGQFAKRKGVVFA